MYVCMYVYTHCQEKLPVMPSLSRSLSERCLEGPAPVNVSMVKITWFLCRRQHISTRRKNEEWHPKCQRHPRRVFFTEGHPSSSNSYHPISLFLSPHLLLFHFISRSKSEHNRKFSNSWKENCSFYKFHIAHFVIYSLFLFLTSMFVLPAVVT